MISDEKVKNALYALQGVINQAKSCLNKSSENKRELAILLDYADYLPFLIANKSDETACYRKVLAEIADRYNYPWILQRFDEALPDGWK